MTKMIVTMLMAGIVLCLGAASVAQACVPLPAPRWDTIPQKGGKGIAIGRIVSVRPDGRDLLSDYAIAEVETLEVLQGAVPELVSLRGVTERRSDPDVITIWCGRLMSGKAGDLVMAVEEGEGRYRLLPKEQIISTYLERMQSFVVQADTQR